MFLSICLHRDDSCVLRAQFPLVRPCSRRRYKGERHITLRSCIGPTLPPTWPLSPTRRLARTHCSWVVLHPTHDYRYPNGLDPSNGPRHSSKKHGSGPAQLDGHRASVGTRHYYYIRSCLGRQVTP